MHRWALLLIILPLMLAQMASGTGAIDVLWSWAFVLISGTFLAYWVWVGLVFSRLPLNKVLAFLLGTSLMILLTLVLVVGFFTEAQPWLPLWNSAHLYPLFVLPLSAQVAEWVSPDPVSLFSILTLGYSMMIGAFSMGFIYSVTRQRRYA